EPREVDDLLVGFHLREVGAERHVGGQCRREAELGVDPALPSDKAARRLPTGAVVPGFDGTAERVGVQLEIMGPVQSAERRNRSFILQLIEPLGPSPRAPQVFLVLAPDETPDVEPELCAHPGVKPQRQERDAELGGPSRRVALRGGRPLVGLALAKVVDRVRRGPPRLVAAARCLHADGANRSGAVLLRRSHAIEQAEPREHHAEARPHDLPCSTNPTSPAATMSTGSGIFLGTSRSVRVTSAMRTVGKSRSERRPGITAPPAIAPGAAAVTPSTSAFTWRFVATRWKCRSEEHTTRYTGRNTPIAASVAPGSPATK